MLRSFAFVALLALATSLRAAAPAKPAALFNGRDFAGWVYLTPNKEPLAAVCSLKPDGVIAVAGKPVGYLATETSYENYTLHAEWRWTDKPGNSGVLLHIASGPVDRNTWPRCFQVQMKNASVGDLLPMADAKFAEPLTTAPGANPALRAHSAPDSEKPVGEWNSCDITCRGDTIEVTINGVAQNKVTKVTPAAGTIGFQLEGVPYELRNVRIAPLK